MSIVLSLLGAEAFALHDLVPSRGKRRGEERRGEVTRLYDTRGKQEMRISYNKQYTGHDHWIVCSRFDWEKSTTQIRQTPGEGVDHCCIRH